MMHTIGKIREYIQRADPERKAHLAAVTCILVFNALVFSPILRHDLSYGMIASHMFAQYPWAAVTANDQSFSGQGLAQKEFAESYYPESVAATYALSHGELPFWDPWSLGGVPDTELSMSGQFYPPRLVAMEFLAPIRQHDFLLIFHLLAAGLGIYALMRYWGANAWGGVLAAIVWELNSHNALNMILEFTPAMSALLPWSILAAVAAVRRRSFPLAIVCGGLAGMIVLAGDLFWASMSLFILALCFGLTAYNKARQENDIAKLRIFYLLPAVSALVCLALSAVVWLPLLAWLPRLNRVSVGMANQIAGGGAWRDMARSLLFPEKAFQTRAETCAFISVTALALTPLAFLRRNKIAWLMGALSLGGFLLFVGCAPAVEIFRVVPFAATFPLHRFLYIICFALSVLAGFGLSEVANLLKGAGTERMRLVFGSTVVVLAALELLIFFRVVTPVQTKNDRWLYPETPLISKLKELQGPYRALPFYFRGPTWSPSMFVAKVPAVFQLHTAGGSSPVTPLNIALLWKTVSNGGTPAQAAELENGLRPVYAHDLLPATLLERISVKYLISGPGLQPADPKLGPLLAAGRARLVYDASDGRIFELPRAVPRAYLVPSVKRVATDDAALNELANGATDFSKTALVSDDVPEFSTEVKDPSELKADIAQDTVDSVDVRVSTPAHAMLVLNDSYAPSWNAYVDGRPAVVHRVNFVYRGVELPPGNHTVLFVYRPASTFVGLGLGLLALLLVLVAGARAIQLALRPPPSSGTPPTDAIERQAKVQTPPPPEKRANAAQPSSISEALRGTQNSLGIIRLALASLVIFSHAFPLSGYDSELLMDMTMKQVSFGAFAVGGFFAISGYLMAKSGMRGDVVQFLWRRVVRIFPGFWAALVVTAFVVAPFVCDSRPRSAFFTFEPTGPFDYIAANWTLSIDNYGIYDIFKTSTPYGRHVGFSVLNGSIWTLRYEWQCYLGAAACVAFGIFEKARGLVLILTACMSAVMVESLTNPGGVAALAPLFADPQRVMLTYMFVLGLCAGVYSNRIPYDDRLGILTGLAVVLTMRYGGFLTLGFAASVYFFLFLAARLPKSVQWVGAKNDYSYGVYIYGFLVQQVGAYLGWYKWGYLRYTLVALLLTFGCAWLSWHLVEKRAMRLKDWGPGRGWEYCWTRAKSAFAACIAELFPRAE